MDDILPLLKDLPKVELGAGEVLIEEGTPKGDMFILIEGEVEVLKREVAINTVDSPGSIFGEISLLLNRPHMATVKAVQPSSFHRVPNNLEYLKQHPDLHLHLTILLARRLNSVTNYLVDIKSQFQEQEDHLGMVDDVLESLLHQQPGKKS